MVLILILMIITSLSIFIIGAMKILTSSDEEFSVNRNTSGGTSTKMLGKFICYKKADGKLYWQRVEYKTDGSIKLYYKENPTLGSDSCTFDIPKGVRSFEISVVGGGGAGDATSRQYKYAPADSDCINDNLDLILKKIKAKLFCKNKYTTTDETSSNTCSGEYDYSGYVSGTYCDKADISNFIKSITGVETSKRVRSCIKYDRHGNCSRYGYSYIKQVSCGSGSGTILAPTKYKCWIEFDGNQIQLDPATPIYNKSQTEVREIIANAIKDEVSCSQKNPIYEVTVGMPGSAGKVRTVTVNSAIFGSDEGADKIIIKKEQIGAGGDATAASKAGGDTKFEYWHKKSKKYIKQSISAAGGAQGSNNKVTINSQEQAENIESKEGEAPTSFSIPSVFEFTPQLHSGYYEGDKPKAATNYGASGASGYIELISSKLNKCTCKKVMINGWGSDGCSLDPPNSRPGTNGAGGIIMISW